MKSYVALVLLLLSCNQKTEKKAHPYFEGVVEFKMEVAGENGDTAMLKEIFGTAAKAFIKGKDVCRIYYNDKGIIVSRELQKTDSLKRYMWRADSDTVYVNDLSKSVSFKAVSIKNTAGKVILGKTCKGVEMYSEYYASYDSEPEYNTAVYYFDSTQKLSPGIYEGVKYGSVEELFSRYPYLTLGYITTFFGGKYRLSMTATKIIPTPMDDTYFQVPKNKTLIASF
ncbi:hypothetical protein [Foetidibacter luteolus]|uniref:hypothetical protein n=1 Tax=Foetidibacter luteolus TaxID=2608880 RepID=UPI00129B4382|nr:hypothetical protein [Foetidibacter luteolus]